VSCLFFFCSLEYKSHSAERGPSSWNKQRRKEGDEKEKDNGHKWNKEKPEGGIGRAKEMDDLSVCATHTHTHTRRRAKKRKCRRRRVRPDKKEEANRADDDDEIKTNVCL
jgi:hypothetical protein